MSHKAYPLRYDDFQAELAPVLFTALATGAAAELEAFVARHRERLSFPWEPAALPTDWRPSQPGNVQELGDVALTLYYDPADDFGLAEEWLEEDAQLPESARLCLLGAPFGPAESPCDPGFRGSYFQSPANVREAERVLAGVARPTLAGFVSGLAEARHAGAGLYVTF